MASRKIITLYSDSAKGIASFCCFALLAWQTSFGSVLFSDDAVTLRAEGVISLFSEVSVRAQCRVWALKVEIWLWG